MRPSTRGVMLYGYFFVALQCGIPRAERNAKVVNFLHTPRLYFQFSTRIHLVGSILCIMWLLGSVPTWAVLPSLESPRVQRIFSPSCAEFTMGEAFGTPLYTVNSSVGDSLQSLPVDSLGGQPSAVPLPDTFGSATTAEPIKEVNSSRPGTAQPDSAHSRQGLSGLDTLAFHEDTLTVKPRTMDKLDAPVTLVARDSIYYNIQEGYAVLYGDGKLNYREQEFQAGYMHLDVNTSQLYARGLNDTTKGPKEQEEPIFKEGATSYRMNEITYNFKSGKARITGVITEVEEGYLHGKIVKKMPNDEVNVAHGKFTTCDLDHPHFYIHLTKAKVIPHDKILTGPAYLVIGDVPTPLGIPFGFFPNSSKRASGIILPEYGEEQQRGFFVRNGGVYLGMSDYIDLALLGGVYSRGSWDVSVRSSYALRYRFQGNITASYSNITAGQKGTSSYNNSNTYRISWSHAQDPAANPNSRFQANVTFGSSGYNRFNSRTTQEYLNNQIMSSISYSRNFPGTPISVSLSLNHSQNSRDSMVSLTLPQLALNVAKVYPFKRRNPVGKPRWYERIGFSYNTNLQNNLHIKEDRLFTPYALNQMRNGMRHNASLSTSFTLLKFVNFTPAVTYSENWYIKSSRHRWDEVDQRVQLDTVNGFARAWQFNVSMGASTKIYGMFEFGQKGWLKAVRHVITPSISLSYHPDFSKPLFGMYSPVQVDAKGTVRPRSHFENTLFGGPSAGQSGTLGFSLGNNLEMKYRKNTDTGTVDRKVKIIESLSIGSSYNFLADSMQLAPLSISAHSTLFNFISLSANSSFSPYALDANLQPYNRFYFKDTKRLLRFENFYFSCSFSLSRVLNGRKEGSLTPTNFGYPPGFIPFDGTTAMPYGYVQYMDFSSPWNLSISYSYSLNVMGEKIRQIQSLSFNGGVTLGTDWQVSFSSGFDFVSRKLTMTSVNIAKDLHCWQMSLNLIPFGTMRSFAFHISVKSAVLKDLKYQKQRSYIDNIL